MLHNSPLAHGVKSEAPERRTCDFFLGDVYKRLTAGIWAKCRAKMLMRSMFGAVGCSNIEAIAVVQVWCVCEQRRKARSATLCLHYSAIHFGWQGSC